MWNDCRPFVGKLKDWRKKHPIDSLMRISPSVVHDSRCWMRYGIIVINLNNMNEHDYEVTASQTALYSLHKIHHPFIHSHINRFIFTIHTLSTDNRHCVCYAGVCVLCATGPKLITIHWNNAMKRGSRLNCFHTRTRKTRAFPLNWSRFYTVLTPKLKSVAWRNRNE